MKYIGDKEIKTYQCNEGICEVEYADSKKETLSKAMFDEIVDDKKCDLSTLRDKRVRPVVAHVLGVMRMWGIKTSEVSYFSQLLNQSLINNENVASTHLWKSINSTINDVEDVSLVDVDKVLKSIVIDPIPSPYGEDTSK